MLKSEAEEACHFPLLFIVGWTIASMEGYVETTAAQIRNGNLSVCDELLESIAAMKLCSLLFARVELISPFYLFTAEVTKTLATITEKLSKQQGELK
jgi:hypothetical protein